MILDTSAVLAILTREPEAERLVAAMARTDRPLMSAGSAVELGIVCARREPVLPRTVYEDWLDLFGVTIVPVDADQVRLAWAAFEAYGKGRHPAGLNFGDCFAYALARQRGLPLLFKGADFSRTDIATVAY
ncbi:type II toxin-antitoxin system VapC family toxin [Chthonobacter rhizosphaerae]|uniref:type II toxin-antitoxin system VapC family toxin n=1 Tax=Chthonobacter rhizosphaerae TaxID=2735553 RepID=UPI0015EEDA3C|nr:type II toxin-antitoxin system VapC family toxin [Chthonobacter rhizosphaerae]